MGDTRTMKEGDSRGEEYAPPHVFYLSPLKTSGKLPQTDCEATRPLEHTRVAQILRQRLWDVLKHGENSCNMWNSGHPGRPAKLLKLGAPDSSIAKTLSTRQLLCQIKIYLMTFYFRKRHPSRVNEPFLYNLFGQSPACGRTLCKRGCYRKHLSCRNFCIALCAPAVNATGSHFTSNMKSLVYIWI